MSAEILREAAEEIRQDCPIPEGSRGFDFIDFPTGWAIQVAGVEHVAACSATVTSGAMLCDCKAVYPTWRRWRTLLAVADWLDKCADGISPGQTAMPTLALALALTYLGRDA